MDLIALSFFSSASSLVSSSTSRMRRARNWLDARTPQICGRRLSGVVGGEHDGPGRRLDGIEVDEPAGAAVNARIHVGVDIALDTLQLVQVAGQLAIDRHRHLIHELEGLGVAEVQAAAYGKQAGFNAVTLAVFVPVEDEEVLEELSGEDNIDGIKVTVCAIGWV